MPTWAARPSDPHPARAARGAAIGLNRARGFTLIEILVTLVIMALLAGLASLSVGGTSHRQALDEVERLAGVLSFASDEATLQGEEYGVQLTDDGYSVLRFDAENETWTDATERQLAPHTLPGSVRMEYSLGEVARLPRRKASPSNGEPERLPEILVLSSGEITPFKLEFRSSDDTQPAGRIVSDGSGKLARE